MVLMGRLKGNKNKKRVNRQADKPNLKKKVSQMSEVTIREYYKENAVREAMWLAQEYGFDTLKAAYEFAAKQERKRKARK